ncbi:phosphomevalonate kinase, partial [Linderina macrospora]
MTLGNSPVTLASAPGKVLVVGGYLVLDRAHSGLVVGTDTCLYAAIQTQVLDISVSATELSISVVSPQFDSAWWQYTFNTATGKLRQHASANDTSNRFVEVVLESTLALATEYVPEALRKLIAEENGLKIVLAADNDFYSQRTTLEKLGLQLSSESLRKIPRMGPTGTTLQGVHKTGLGSSAAMVTSLVAALLAHLGAVPMSSLDPKNHGTGESQQSLRLVHNIAQYAHCLAQGKIGSGFDVSSAVYGSHEYRRFSPSVLEDAMAQTSDTAAVKNAVSPKNAAWDNEATPVRIPPGFKLRLADVDAGSNTPSMVRKILQWKQSFPEKSSKLWQALHDANGQIRALWDKLNDAHESDPKDYDDAIA